MDAHDSAPAEAATSSSDISDLELALNLADLPAGGFDASVTAALASAGATLLFLMPAPDGSRVAAASIGEGAARQVLLVVLASDGAVSVETPEASASPIAGLAASYARVMDHMPAIAA